MTNTQTVPASPAAAAAAAATATGSRGTTRGGGDTSAALGNYYRLPLLNYHDPSVDLAGKSVLVTGGTGSFGKRLVKSVLDRYDPRRLIRQRRGLARQRHPAVPEASPRGRGEPTDYRSAHDPVLDHPAAGRRLLALVPQDGARRRAVRAEDPQHAHDRPGRAPGTGIPIRIVGIRPGEKLHEVLITAEEARSAVELKDRYIIRPTLQFWTDLDGEDDGPQGAPVAEDFVFSSDRNSDWLDADQLEQMLQEGV